jgi:hypothetical protein
MYYEYLVNVNMDGKTLFDGASPKTQSIEAVKALLTWKGRAVDPLPSVVEFANEGEESRLVLVLSNKKDVYYVTTATKCSCPSQTYRGGPCKHMRKYFGAKLEQAATGSIRPEGKWTGGMNGPVDGVPGDA